MVINHDVADDRHFSLFLGLLFKNHFFYILKTQILESVHWAGRAQAERERQTDQFPSLLSRLHLEMKSLHLLLLPGFLKKMFYGSRSEFSRILAFSVSDIHAFIHLTFTDAYQLQSSGREKVAASLRMDCCCKQACTHVYPHMCAFTHAYPHSPHIYHMHMHMKNNNSFHRALLIWLTFSSVSEEPSVVSCTFCFSFFSASHPAFQLISKIYSLPCPCLWRSHKRDVHVERWCLDPEIWDNFAFKAGYESGDLPN